MTARQPRGRSGLFLAGLVFTWVTAEAGAGTINVNSAADTNQNDDVVTLREALLIARGDRTPWDHPDPDVDDEARQVTGSVGAGVFDEIRVLDSLGVGPIQLADFLPPLDDAADSIHAASALELSFLGLTPGEDDRALDIRGGGHQVVGFRITFFNGTPIVLDSADNRLLSMQIVEPFGAGVELNGPAATGNLLSSVVVDGALGPGIRITGGASENLIQNCFLISGQWHGVEIGGAGTDLNVLSSVSIGLNPGLAASGNLGWGVRVHDGARFNEIGRPNASGEITLISNNELGGILIEGDGTDDTIIDHAWIGADFSGATRGAGNGSGPGVEVRDGPDHTEIGVLGLSRNVIISGHADSGIRISGAGTDGTNVQRTFVGGPNPFDGSVLLTNAGHGIGLVDGPELTTIGELDDTMGAAVEINGAGLRADGSLDAAKHGVLIRGSESALVRTVQFNFIHFGNERGSHGAPVFGGDVIRLEGHVEDVEIGAPQHRNHLNGAAGYGLRITGPNVSRVRSSQLHVGEYFGQAAPNAAGGILIENGASDIVISDVSLFGNEGRSYICGNGGPGITIDARGTPPSEILVQNAWVGLDESGAALPNEGHGILIEDAAATSPEVLTGVRIGTEEEDTRNVVSGNGTPAQPGSGIRLSRVAGVSILGNRVGTDADGLTARPNALHGIDVDGCEDITVGSTASETSGNLLSGNTAAGLRLEDSHSLQVQANLIGLTSSGTGPLANGTGVRIEIPRALGGALVIGGANTWLGGDAGGSRHEGNAVSGNLGDGIEIELSVDASAQAIRLEGNHVGADAEGIAAVANGGAGVHLHAAERMPADVLIGHAADRSRGNVLSANAAAGLLVDGVDGFSVFHGLIGLDRQGQPLAGQPIGVDLKNVGAGRIGSGQAPHGTNTISGNAEAGIRIGRDCGGVGLRIEHNFIGTDPNGQAARANRDGVLVQPAMPAADPRPLVIGGPNPAMGQAAPPADRLGAGNLISGNSRDGIRVEAPTENGFSLVRFEGNVIGLEADGETLRPNGEVGLRIWGKPAGSTDIGSLTEADRGNLISGNVEAGVVLDFQAGAVRIGHGLVGTDITGAKRAGNANGAPGDGLGRGVVIRGGSRENELEKNRIWFNEEEGVFVTGPATERNRIQDNSIHGNGLEGIRLTGGANAGIEAPILKRAVAPSEPTSGLTGRCSTPNGRIEVFVDPLVGPGDPGYFGQGRKRVLETFADSFGNFVVPLSFPDSGVITATVRDAEGNTSEFSPFMGALVIQSVETEEERLVANKPTVVRVFADTGRGAVRRTVGGSLTLGGGPLIAPMPATQQLRPLFGYHANLGARRTGADSLNFFIPAPPTGAQQLSVTMTEGGLTRGKLELPPVDFQVVDSFPLGLISVLSRPAGGGNYLRPRPALMWASVRYLSDLFPFDPTGFMARVRQLPGIVREQPPTTAARRKSIIEEAEERRAASTLADGSKFRYAAAFVNAASGMGALGLTRGDFPQVVLLRDAVPTAPGHGGATLIHEFGHTKPFLLADTYRGGACAGTCFDASCPSCTQNFCTGAGQAAGCRTFAETPPNPVDPSASTVNGNLMEDADWGFAAAQPFSVFGLSGPVFTASAATQVHDFMGGGDPAWVEPQAYEVLFDQAVAGGLRSAVLAEAHPWLLVRADVTELSGSLLPVRRAAPGSFETGVDQAAGDWSVTLEGGAGEVLDVGRRRLGFLAEVRAEEGTGSEAVDGTGFMSVLSEMDGATRLVLRREDEELDAIVITPSAPVVDLVAPHGPASLAADFQEVSWTAGDADGDELWFDVFYTPDDGLTRLAVAVGLRGQSSVTVPTADLPAGPAPRFIVRASDRWNESEARSEPPIQVADRMPTAEITAPAAGELLFDDLPVRLMGVGLDTEDGILLGAAAEWFLDGLPLATGMSPTVMLPTGAHLLRFEVTDSAGQVAAAELSVGVGRPPPWSTDIIDFMLGRIEEPEGADVNGDGRVDVLDIVAARSVGR